MSGTGDSRPLGIGLVGLGRAGTFHLERIGLREDCRIVTTFDCCAEATRKAADLVSRFAESWRDLLDDEEVELVLLATPPASHAPLAMEALAAGKHVLVETPLCLSLAEVGAVLAAARRANRSVIVAHTRRWDDDFRAAQRECGNLGRLRIIKHVNWHSQPLSLPLNRECNSPNFTLPLQAALWRNDPLTGGGPLWEFGVHDFDQLLQLAGEPPHEISTELYGGQGANTIEEGFLAIVRFPSGLVAHVEVHHAAAVLLQTGWIVVGSERSFGGNTNFTVTIDGEVVDVPISPAAGESDEFYESIVAHLRRGAPNPVPAEQARDTIALIEAARKSTQTGRPALVEP